MSSNNLDEHTSQRLVVRVSHPDDELAAKPRPPGRFVGVGPKRLAQRYSSERDAAHCIVGLPATSCSGLMTLTTSDALLDHAAVAALTTDDQFSRFSAQM